MPDVTVNRVRTADRLTFSNFELMRLTPQLWACTMVVHSPLKTEFTDQKYRMNDAFHFSLSAMHPDQFTDGSFKGWHIRPQEPAHLIQVEPGPTNATGSSDKEAKLVLQYTGAPGTRRNRALADYQFLKRNLDLALWSLHLDDSDHTDNIPWMPWGSFSLSTAKSATGVDLPTVKCDAAMFCVFSLATQAGQRFRNHRPLKRASAD